MNSKRKLIIIAAALVCMLFVPVLASADFVKVGDSVTILKPGPTWEGPYSVIDNTNPAANFATFCVETTETISSGGTYTVTGVGAAVVHGISTIPTSQTLQSPTAFLYRQYLNGATGEFADFNALQAAIYHFQGVGGMTNGVSNTLGLPNFTLFGLTDATHVAFSLGSNVATFTDYTALLADAAAASGFYSVAVMNLGSNQDMLTPAPLPGTVLLLGSGLMGLMGWKRVKKS